jgi:hypothetical protein
MRVTHAHGPLEGGNFALRTADYECYRPMSLLSDDGLSRAFDAHGLRVENE